MGNLQQQSFNMEQQNYALQSLKDTQHTVRPPSSRPAFVHPAVVPSRQHLLFFLSSLTGRGHENGRQGHEEGIQED